MSQGHWLHNLATRGWLIAVVVAASAALYAQDKPQDQPQTPPAGTTQQQATEPSSPAPQGEDAIKSNWSKPNCDKPQQHSEADLCQQIRMADSAKQTAILNGVQIAIGFVTLIG